MSQTFDTLTGADLGSDWPTDWNNARAALLSSHSGSSAPAYVDTGLIWYNSTDKTFYGYDGASNVGLFTLDTTNHIVLPRLGGGVTTVASASTVDIGASYETHINITGTTTISSFGSSMKQGQMKTLVFTGALTLSYNATSMIIPGGVDLSIAAGDAIVVLCVSSGNYRVVLYQPTGGYASVAQLALKANIASPTFTGTPAAPTATTGTNTTQLATTAFVQQEISGFTGSGRRLFTNNGTFTAPSGVTTVYLTGAGGGGGGGYSHSSGGGGSGHSVYRFSVTVVPSTGYSVVIGTGGAGGTSGHQDGYSGIATTFGATVTLSGGGGGTTGGFTPGVSIGFFTAPGGSAGTDGVKGEAGFAVASSTSVYVSKGGSGGGNVAGGVGGRGASVASSSAGNSYSTPGLRGGGGGGGPNASTSGVGSDGGKGFLLVEW